MLPHLHLHLEPERRKRAQLGLPTAPQYRNSAAAFFASHDVRNRTRVPVTGDDLGTFIREIHAEQRHEHVDYAELRLSPRRFLVDGLSLEEFLQIAHATMQPLESPAIRGILLVNRDSTRDFLEQCTAHLDDLPATFVGVDLAGDESRYPDVTAFRDLFTAAKAIGLGVTVHAGEFGDLDGVWRALDELGAQRLGHALAAVRSPSLLKRLRDDKVLVEVSLSSNLMLGAVASVALHPVRVFFDAGIPVSFNTDIPIESRSTLPAELALAARLLGLTTEEVVAVQRGVARFVFRTAER
ncbi:hypothetical protein [Micromonospora sp. CP22]|uniref:adenosine deaminase family protein n=1 Tax=Micromonospora sp. CP22 TaxID=2580517 RepID=UPI0012BB57C3|nr:hypothetical protein [Micromonospora sp. CP22]MTK04524.1 hypothetical protein [Micromonospora sp. CP22]